MGPLAEAILAGRCILPDDKRLGLVWGLPPGDAFALVEAQTRMLAGQRQATPRVQSADGDWIQVRRGEVERVFARRAERP